MTFWTNSGFEPKRAFRFKVTIAGIEPFYVKKITKPKFTLQEAEHKFLNRSYFFPGHVTWDPVTVTFVDDVHGNVVNKLSAAIANSNYADIISNPMTKNDPYRTIQKQGLNKYTAEGALGTGQINPLIPIPSEPLTASVLATVGNAILIEQIDSTGDIVVEQTVLHNGWIKSITPSELSYDTEDLSTYDLEIRYDWAQILPTGKKK